MANLPDLRSKSQIVGDLIDGFLARVPYIDDLNRGSIITQFFNAIGQSQFIAAADVISMIDAMSVDRAEGEALQRLARDKAVVVSPGTYASGRVDITDTSINKISSQVFTGQPAPVAGSLVIYVANAADFNSNGGEIYIGRGTPNVEGPLSYDSVQQEGGGTFWSITLNSSSPTTKFHNAGEEVVLAQGGRRSVSAGSVVKTSSGSGVDAISFKTNAQADIPDGEVKVTGVSVTCDQLGITGNVPRGAIRQAEGFPFPASVFNANALTNGTPPDDEETIRDNIKRAEQAKSNGTEEAIRSAAIGVTSPDDLKTVQSASILRYADTASALIFDDGTGYEPIFSGVGLEQVMDDALGGEIELQLRQYPVASARVVTLNLTPYALQGGESLEVTISNETTTHTFDASSFKVPNKATAFEVAAAINGDANINFSANTAEGGQAVVIFPRDRSANDIQVKVLAADDANDKLNFPTQLQRTLLLYKNDQLLSQDGRTAFINTRDSSTWSTSITAGDTLIYEVDGTPPITVTFSLAAFREVDIGSTVSAFTSLDTWVEVMNNLMSGVVATLDGTAIRIASARGESSEASLKILGGTIQDKMFQVGADLSVTGTESEFTLNKETGQIGLAEPLDQGDKITAGSSFTRANITTTSIADGPSGDGNLWMVIDGAVTILENGLAGDSITSFSKDPVTEKITIGATTPTLESVGFDLVQPGDWIVVWAEAPDLGDYPALYNFQGFWRVETAKRGEIVVDDEGGGLRGPNGLLVIPTDRIVVVRSDAVVQQLSFGISTLSGFAQEVEAELEGVSTTIIGSQVRISTKSANDDGELALIAADSGGKALGLSPITTVDNIPSQQGFIETETSGLSIPSFTWGEITSRISDTVVELPEYPEISGSYDDYLVALSSYDLSSELQAIVPDSLEGKAIYAQFFDKDTNELTLDPPLYVQNQISFQTLDRYYKIDGLRLTDSDILTAIVDDDLTTKVFGLPVSRKVTIDDNSTPTLIDISIADAESSLEINDAASFGGFSFDDWKIWRQANAILTDGVYSLRAKYADKGPTGDSVRLGFVYPQSATQTEISLTYLNEETTGVGVVLPVQDERDATWAADSCFTVDVVNISPAKDEITFTWRTGTQPTFLTGPANTQISIGDIVIIASNADFLPENRDIQAQVTGITDTTFTVETLANQLVSDSVSAIDIQTINGTMTVTTAIDHDIEKGDRVGLWGTSPISGSNTPYDFVFYPVVTSPTTFTVDVGDQIPGGLAIQGTHSDGLVTVTTQDPHGLEVGAVVIISDFSLSNYNGLASVLSIPSPTQFTYIRQGSSATVVNGRFDYQTYGLTGVGSIVSADKVGGTVTVTTAAAHGLSNGNLVSITGADVADYAAGTSYNVGDVIEYSGILYKSKVAANLGNQPDISPASWGVTIEDLDISGAVINVTGATTFEMSYSNSIGDTFSTGGSLSLYGAQAEMARALGNSVANLAFVDVSTTAQDVIDFISDNYSNTLKLELYNGTDGSETISSSTADNDLATGYIAASADTLTTFNGSQSIELTVDTNIPAGSTISLTGVGSYDDTYTVLSVEETVPSTTWTIKLLSSIKASSTSTSAITGDIVGQTRYVALVDGERSIATTDLDAVPFSPMLALKSEWLTVPEIGDEVALVAVRKRHLVDFWNRLIVTGLPNATEIQTSQVGEEIQITTNTFGRDGSVEIAGGSANSKTVALVGSGSEQDKLGVFLIPTDLRSGLTTDSWVQLGQTEVQNKLLGLDSTSLIETQADGIELQAGNGSFQTKRIITADKDSVFKVEKHGDFIAIVNVGGTAIGLDAAGVVEGDWVRIKNTLGTAWLNALDYTTEDRASYNGLTFTAINDSLSTNPVKPVPDEDWDADTTYVTGDIVRFKNRAWRYDGVAPIASTNPEDAPDWILIWEVQEWAGGNTGIFQVVRTFADNTFYIENTNAIEELIDLGDAENLSFFSYDSVMPGDVLAISGSVLGVTNAGRYVVQDDSGTTSFPTSTRIWTEQIPVSGVSAVLGDKANQVNVEEKTPTLVWKKIVGIAPASDTLTAITVDTPNLINKFSSSNGAFATMQGKLEYTTLPQFGIDAYLHFGGLIKELNRVVYGDPTSADEFPGVRAAGSNVAISAAIIRGITLDMSIRVKTGIPFSEVREAAKGAAAGYINTLGTGQSISLSKVVEAVSKVNGVTSVVITFPDYNIASDRIAVGSQEKALVGDPTNDITVSVLGT